MRAFAAIRAAFLGAGCGIVVGCFLATPITAAERLSPGLHDLVVYDPSTHERGFPAVQLNPKGDGLVVDIPPTIHIHRYYYSGDKEIQGPIIAGGPTVVVANHPKTGERMYIDVMLPAGAPRIAYDKHGITYVYPNQRVEVRFHRFPFSPDNVAVKNHSGQGWGRTIQDAHQHLTKSVKESLENSPTAQSVKESSGETADFLAGVKVSLGELSTRGGDSLKTLTNMIPGVVYLKSLAEQEPERDFANSIRAAGITKERLEPAFVPTNR